MQALFKARYEQALESQKLNIKKIETQLRRKGINPEDPVAMASIQRVASTFFRAIDEQQGTPYVFRGDNQPTALTTEIKEPRPSDDSDQEELDHFIAEIESAAEKQWEEEEAAEKEETSRLQYRYREEMGERRGFSRGYDNSDGDDGSQGRYSRDNSSNKWTDDTRRWDDDSEIEESGEDVDERRGFNRNYGNSDAEDTSQGRYRRDNGNNRRMTDSRRRGGDTEASGEDWDSDDGRDSVAGFDNERGAPDEHPRRFESMRHERSRPGHRQNYTPGASRSSSRTPKSSVTFSGGSEDDDSDTEDDEVWGSDYKDEPSSRAPKVNFPNYESSSSSEDEGTNDNWKRGGGTSQVKKNADEDWDSD